MFFFSFLCDPQADLFYPVNDYFIEGSATNLSLPICASDTCVIHLHVLSTLSWGEPGRTGGGRGTANGRRKGGKQDPCDGGERERNSKRQAFVICYCLHPVKETNPKTFLDFHLTFSEA